MTIKIKRANHSPGPWGINYVKEKGKVVSYAIMAKNGTPIALSANVQIPATLENTLLIAAAPDLLAAAKLALKECADLIGTDEGRALEDAIAKAEPK
jgi:hypothetical protein